MGPSYQRDLFMASAPRRPFCSDDLGSGLRIRGQAQALAHRYIQHNPPNVVAFLVFDFDRPGALIAAADAGLPEPTWVAENRDSRRGHLAYALTCPITKTAAARAAPMRYAAAVEQAYRDALRADSGYTNFITKTPGHTAWETRWGRAEGFTLEELAEYLPAGLPTLRKRREQASGLGRNVSLFEGLRAWSYRARKRFDYFEDWHRATHDRAEFLNGEFSCPLPASEVRATAKSVAKWVWANLGNGPEGAKFFARQKRKSDIAGSLRQAAAMDTAQRILEFRK